MPNTSRISPSSLSRFTTPIVRLIALALVLTLTPQPGFAQPAPSVPAFPGAEGFGAQSIGGRGGVVFEVVNLNDSGPGSLRAAIESSGPRTVVFRVGGTIELDSSFEILNPYITIAGQTAPGDGIALKNSSLNAKTPLKIETHDVIVRYLRSRPGSNPNETGTLDALTISSKDADVYNVIVDHCSFSWATDEVTNLYYAAHDLTVQWSIVAEGLDCPTHVEDGETQCHSMGMLVGHEGSRDYSIHHNLFAHNRRRNPRIKTTGLVDVVNNVVYNSGTGWNSRSPTYVNGELAAVPANYVGNFFKPGVDSGDAEWFIDTKLITSVYIEGNSVPNLVVNPDPEDQANLTSVRHPAAPVTTTSAQEAFDQVLSDVGANIGLNCDGSQYSRRDSADARVVAEVISGTGRIIDEPEEVGGWPILASGTPCVDGDHDGMPDEWESIMGLNSLDPSDRNQLSPAGYTWLEEYLNQPFMQSESLNVRMVTPASGPPAGGTPVSISGTGFDPGAEVRFGTEPATAVVVTGSNVVTAQTPPGPSGVVDVTVTNPDQETSTLENGFEYMSPAVADLVLIMTDGADPIEAGDSLIYSFVVLNNGPSEAPAVVVQDVLPNDLTLLSTSGCAEDPSGVPACSLGAIPSGSSSSFSITAASSTDSAATVTNTATVASASVDDPDFTNNVASETTTVNPPPAAPTAPSNLSARAQTTGKGRRATYAGSITLSWQDQSANEDEFLIERCDNVVFTGKGKKSNGKNKNLSCDGGWGQSLSILVSANSTTYSDATAVAQSSYIYRVSALNSAGSSDYSNEAPASTP